MRNLLIVSILFTTSLFSQNTANVNIEEIAEKIGLKLPVIEAVKTFEELEKELNDKAEKEIQNKFPSKSIEAFTQEVISVYPAYTAGDNVKIKVRYRGSLKEIEGRFKKITDTSIYIGSQSYPIVDIESKVAAQFSPEKWKTEVEKAAKKKFLKHESDRRYGREDYFKKHKETFFTNNGYSFVRDKWIKSSEFLQMAVTKAENDIIEAKKQAEENAKSKAQQNVGQTERKSQGSTQSKTKSKSKSTKESDSEEIESDEGKSKGAAFLLIGIYIIMCINSLAFLFAIFCEDGFLWLLGCIFIPFVSLIILIKGWQTYKKFFFIHIALIAISLALIFLVGIEPGF